MKTPIDRIRTGAVVFGITIVVATAGYFYLGDGDRSFVNSLYMVVITVAGVGYTDEASQANQVEQLFTIGVIAVGMAAGAYTIGGLLQLMTEGEIQRALGHHRMTENIRKLSDHVVVCGYGRIGRILTRELSRKRLPFVVIEGDTERLNEAAETGHLVVEGDATDEQMLIDAGVERARCLVTSLPGDADNVFITLSARDLNKGIQIIARAERPTTEKKLLRAGATKVVMPATIGANQMARLVTRPSTANLIELVGDRTNLRLELDEIAIGGACKLVGKSVTDTEANQRYHLLIVAVNPVDAEMEFNPSGDYVFQVGDTLIVMGGEEDIQRFVSDYELN